MQDLLSVLFYVRKSKHENATQATVYLRINYDGRRAEISSMRKDYCIGSSGAYFDGFIGGLRPFDAN